MNINQNFSDSSLIDFVPKSDLNLKDIQNVGIEDKHSTLIVFFPNEKEEYKWELWRSKNNELVWISLDEQRSDQWKKLRHRRISASKFGAAINHSNFDNDDPDLLAEVLAGSRDPPPPSEAARKRMDFGTENEPLARDYYQRTLQCQVKELGLSIPQSNFEIGASLDGEVIIDESLAIGSNSSLVELENLEMEGLDLLDVDSKDLKRVWNKLPILSEGMIEIKCPEKMYPPIKDYVNKQEKWKKWPHLLTTDSSYPHIYQTHYDQMQGCMAITGKLWCDYVIFCPKTDEVFIERIPFSNTYWENILFSGLHKFVSNKLRPSILLTAQNPQALRSYPRIDPPTIQSYIKDLNYL